MTSGNIQMGPGPDEVLDALKRAIGEDPGLRRKPAGEISRGLAQGGYLEEEPDPVLVAEMVEGIEDEDATAQPDELSEEANPT
jgi:hypothetical protein